VTSQGLTPTVAAFTYTTGDGTPHGVDAIDETSDGTADAVFTYDQAGRYATRTINGTETTFTWDAASNLVKAVVDATPGTAGGEVTWIYVYDTTGQRVAKLRTEDTDSDGSLDPVAGTVYMGDTEITDTDTKEDQPDSDDLHATRYVTFGGSTVAVFEGTSYNGNGSNYSIYMIEVRM